MRTNNQIKEQIYRILNNVQTPGQYIGGEINSVSKPLDTVQNYICLSFPDAYTIGMSNHGFKLLYEIVNDFPDLACERVFTPWPDMAQVMRENNIPLFTLESFTPVIRFPLWGFSMNYEVAWTNLLEMLDLAGVPLYSKDRAEEHPIILAGGHGSYNPEPGADFIDLMVLGDGEEILPALMHFDASLRNENVPRIERIREIAKKFVGVYAPSFYSVKYHPNGEVAEISPEGGVPSVVESAVVSDLNSISAGIKPIVPWVEVTQDRICVEIMRGCTHGCRFCQASMIRRPLRIRSLENIVESARKAYDNTGYNEISLNSLSSSDYPGIKDLIKKLIDVFNDKKVSVNLPSLRINEQLSIFPELIASVRKSTLTMAPEVGSERLRRVINKNISNQELFKGIEDAYRQGWSTVKLYFMIGLPTERPEDHEKIAEMAMEASRIGRGFGKRSGGVTLSISTFVPKSHTPFQWVPLSCQDNILNAQSTIKKALAKNRKIDIKFHSLERSTLEAVLARGDRRLAPAILTAWRSGAKFDAWSDYFIPNLWQNAFKNSGIDPGFYLYRNRERKEVFPWDHLSSGVSKDFLWREFEKAMREEETPNCVLTHCHGCGLENSICRHSGAAR